MKTLHFGKIPPLSLLLAPLLALYLLYIDYLPTAGIQSAMLLFVFFNAYTALALNWAPLWQSPQRRHYWLLIGGVLSAAAALLYWQLSHWGRFFNDPGNAYAFHLLFVWSLLCQLLIYLGAVRLSRREAFSLDSNLLIVFNRYFGSAFLLASFGLLVAVVLGLGFGLLYLLGLSLNQQALLGIIGLALGSIPVFLLLIPLQARPYPFPYLFIFQWIALIFIGIYLLFALLRLDIDIDSGLRLSIAAFLWLLAVVAHDPKQPQRLLNLLTAAAGLILAAMSLYGIGLRLYSQGISELRSSALFIAVLLCIGFAGIGLKALLKSKALSDRLCTYTLGLMTAALAIFIFLPLPQWTLDDQTARYLQGRKTAAQLYDDRYFFTDYGTAGQAALDNIAAHYGIDNFDGNDEYGTQSADINYQLWKNRLPDDIDRYFHRIPADTALPDNLRESLLRHLWNSDQAQMQKILDSNAPDARLFTVRAVDADRNPATAEWLAVQQSGYDYSTFYHYRLIPDGDNGGTWQESSVYPAGAWDGSTDIFANPDAEPRYHHPRYLYQDILIGEGEAQIRIEMPKIEIED